MWWMGIVLGCAPKTPPAQAVEPAPQEEPAVAEVTTEQAPAPQEEPAVAEVTTEPVPTPQEEPAVAEVTMEQFLATQEEAARIAWAAIDAGAGRPPREVREEILPQIRSLAGVKDAGVSSDNYSIWIKYVDGRSGLLMLSPPGTR